MQASGKVPASTPRTPGTKMRSTNEVADSAAKRRKLPTGAFVPPGKVTEVSENDVTMNQAAQTLKSDIIVGWFRNDLRLSDNPMLHEVVQRAEAKDLPSILVYILDPRFYDASEYGRVTNQARPGKSAMLRRDTFLSRKCNGRRARFYLNVLRDLQRGLNEVGTELWIFYGKPDEVFSNLSMQYGALEVVCLREPVSPEWTDVEETVAGTLNRCNGSLTTLWGAMGLYHEEDMPFAFKNTPKSYTSITKKLGWVDLWTSTQQHSWSTPIREPLPMLKGPWKLAKAAPPKGAWTNERIDSDRDALKSLGFSSDEIEATLKVPYGGSRKGKGGETAAWQRFKAFMDVSPEPVKDDPNFKSLGAAYGAAGANFVKVGEIDPFQWRNLSTSAGWMQLSKYMACGCISPREMYHELLKKNHWALPGVVHRFMWREWHRYNAIKYQVKLFRLTGPGGQYQFNRYGNSEAAQKWKFGQTGTPYIDACMRELNETGWLPYHKRKTVACFLCHDLMVDWRLGGFHFEEVLLDYDVAMNYGNWTFCARVDKGYGDRYKAQGFRDPEHESVQHTIEAYAASDANGMYVRQWVPELRDVPPEFLHRPWLMSEEQQRAARCIISKDYPEPLIKFPEAKRQKEEVRYPALWALIGLLEKFGKFPAVGLCFLSIVYLTGNINNPNNLGKQLCIVCSHNAAIGYLFDRQPEGIYVGFPHFGPLSVDVPVLRLLARFWSYEMIAIRFATALRPLFIPGLWASFMSLIIPQSAVFAPWQLGSVLTSDYFKNPISFASVNGFPALIWLMWFLYLQLTKDGAVTSLADLNKVWVDMTVNVDMDLIAITLGLLPFLITLAYKIASQYYWWALRSPSYFPGNGKTFFPLMVSFAPCCLYLLYAGWALVDVHKVMYAFASLMPIWWVNCLGGVDLWIEEPLGLPAREIAFTPTWIVTHGVFFLQWALEPKDYINRLCFIFYMCPQMVFLNYYFRNACAQDWGTQGPILYSYFMHAHMTVMELYYFWSDIMKVGISEIFNVVVKDCPLHFTPAQLTALAIVCSLVILSPNAKYRWTLYSLLGPLNWCGII